MCGVSYLKGNRTEFLLRVLRTPYSDVCQGLFVSSPEFCIMSDFFGDASEDGPVFPMFLSTFSFLGMSWGGRTQYGEVYRKRRAGAMRKGVTGHTARHCCARMIVYFPRYLCAFACGGSSDEQGIDRCAGVIPLHSALEECLSKRWIWAASPQALASLHAILHQWVACLLLNMMLLTEYPKSVVARTDVDMPVFFYGSYCTIQYLTSPCLIQPAASVHSNVNTVSSIIHGLKSLSPDA